MAQHGANHLLGEEGKAYMAQKSPSPSQFSQRIAPRIWEKQDDIKNATQSQRPEMGTDARI